METENVRLGIIYVLVTYLVWGALPMYWKLLGTASSGEILASRIVWSFGFMIILLLITRRLSNFKATIKEIKKTPKLMLALASASLIISCNWFIYIYAVNSDQVVQASLGYYMNPLVSVLLGVFVLKERLSLAQLISFGLALIGVIILTISYGEFPWIAIGLALSFALYGLAKKTIPVSADIGLTLETMFIMPVALIYLIYLFFTQDIIFLHSNLSTDLLLLGSGIATAVPLLYFAKGARVIPLTTLGFLQYTSPTIMLFLGVFVYDEVFSKIDMLAFVFIWLALLIYTISFTKSVGRKKQVKGLKN